MKQDINKLMKEKLTETPILEMIEWYSIIHKKIEFNNINPMNNLTFQNKKE